MNKAQIALVGFIVCTIGGVLLLANTVEKTATQEAIACKEVGGEPQQISGATICFAPNVVLTLGETE